MRSLNINLPQPWFGVSVEVATRAAQIDELVGSLEDLGPDVQAAAARYFSAVFPELRALGLSAMGALLISEGDPPDTVQATCAIGTVPRREFEYEDSNDLLHALAEAGPHPGLERDTTALDLPIGPAVRSAAFRFGEEFLDTDGMAPYVGEVRYTFEVDDDLIGILHFETQTLVYFEELQTMFDRIAETARVE